MIEFSSLSLFWLEFSLSFFGFYDSMAFILYLYLMHTNKKRTCTMWPTACLIMKHSTCSLTGQPQIWDKPRWGQQPTNSNPLSLILLNRCCDVMSMIYTHGDMGVLLQEFLQYWHNLKSARIDCSMTSWSRGRYRDVKEHISNHQPRF